MDVQNFFAQLAQRTAHETGRPWVFFLAVGTVLVWALTGPIFEYSDAWQLVINTGTTIVTFLMVFLIQNAQNRDTQAIQLKLDELIRATEGAHNRLIALEGQTDEVMEEVRAELASSCEPAPLVSQASQEGRQAAAPQ
ncbi:low affinity iron permease family protein [Sabulicella rubraurantiaca]|uniref:low affinity iron permease family protein n=1 Tax=Sabulicella rubraurantiaca TaxID=2811429 RepID=UPI001A96E6C7|nr:low affinity iron permease family protein [Sabulicella rubraurantiaca]